MSKFNYQDYTERAAKRTDSSFIHGNENRQRIGFFKLKNDGDSCLVRFDVSTLDDLDFAAIHRLGAADHWRAVSCLSSIKSSNHDDCPFCKAVKNGNTEVSKMQKRVYVKRLVSYFDKEKNAFIQVAPVIWERPAGFGKEIFGLLNDYQNLKAHVFKITRSGAAGSKDTRYTISYIPAFDNTTYIPEDFTAFDNFDIGKHSYWEKTADEMETWLATGKFPEAAQTATKIDAVDPNLNNKPSAPAPTVQPAPAQAPAAPRHQETPADPTRAFNKFTF